MKIRSLIIILIFVIILTGCARMQPQPIEADNLPEEFNSENSSELVSQEDSRENKEDDAQGDIELEVQPEGPICPLTGLPYHGEYKPVAMIIENSPAARPQSGLIDADLVYEAHAEGGITRFLAIFLSEMPEKVGPIRSLRHYFMHMAREWDALLVHYGQSFIAEQQFNSIQVHRLNGLYMAGEGPFWRDRSRKAPHNVYINAKDCIEQIDFKQQERGFEFTTNPLADGREYKRLIIPYHKSASMVEYRYDEEKGLNMRYINGEPHVDKETGEQLYNKNIIVQYAKHGILEPGAGYREIELIGSGKAVYFIGGRYEEGTWHREGPNAPTQYLDGSGKPIRLAPGKTWIEVVPRDMEISVE